MNFKFLKHKQMDATITILKGTLTRVTTYLGTDGKAVLTASGGVSPYFVKVSQSNGGTLIGDYGPFNEEPDGIVHIEIDGLPTGDFSAEVRDSSPSPLFAYFDGFEIVSPPLATLNATINTLGIKAVVKFEYGIDENYDNEVFYGEVTSNSPLPISMNLSCGGGSPASQLIPNTTYHYRFIATDDAGTTLGPDATFVTPTYAPIIVNLPPTGIV